MYTIENKVNKEKNDLDRKIVKLEKFIQSDDRFNTEVTDEGRDLLKKQLDVMVEYSAILLARLATF